MSNHNRIIKYQAVPLDGDAVPRPITGGFRRDMPGMSGETTMYEVELKLHLDADSWQRLAEWLHTTMNAQGKRHEDHTPSKMELVNINGRTYYHDPYVVGSQRFVTAKDMEDADAIGAEIAAHIAKMTSTERQTFMAELNALVDSYGRHNNT